MGLTHCLLSNNKSLLNNQEYFEYGEIFSQITNWETLEDISIISSMESYCYLLDDPNLPFEISQNGNKLFIQGNLTLLESEGLDKRWNILGNIGVWFRYIISIQEQHGIYSLHAASIYKPNGNELLLIIGKAGVGKSVYLLESIKRGYQIFSTEMTYFNITPGKVVFYRGALVDNIRVGTFRYDFPESAASLGIEVPKVENPWEHKFSVSLHPSAAEKRIITNPKVSLIFPHIERGYTKAITKNINDRGILKKLLFESASEKVGCTILVNGQYPFAGFDTHTLAKKRWETIKELVNADHWEIKQARTILSDPQSCFDGIDDG